MIDLQNARKLGMLIGAVATYLALTEARLGQLKSYENGDGYFDILGEMEACLGMLEHVLSEVVEKNEASV